jgi:dihydrolipoamide dehydrogenase
VQRGNASVSSFDLVVIGSGPGGYVAAIRAAQLGMRVAIVERDRLGGVCLNWGCIPSKAILHAAELYDEVRRGVPGLVFEKLSVDYGAVIDASRKAADRLNRGVGSLMKKNAIEVVEGSGRVAGGGRVVVQNPDGERTLQASNVLVATGSTERVFEGVSVDGRRVTTSREALEARELPESVVIIGGGAVGLEFAYAYVTYGVKTTVIEMTEQLLPGIDAEVAGALEKSFARRKAAIRTSTAYRGLDVSGDGVAVTVEGEKGEEEIRAEQAFFAVGRRALTEGMGLEEAGVEVEKGFVKVGPDYRTTAEGVWAIGDVIGPPLLAHAASEEGVLAVEIMAGQQRKPLDPRRVPVCIYCQPQVASVGLSEAEARAAGVDVKVGKFPFAASGKAVAVRHTDGFAKLVTDARYGEILGCQVIGAGATELIAEVTLGMNLETTVREVAETSHAHPTMSEAIMEAALDAEGRVRNF